jgi:SPP1 gp7 family putative phage head morphogenesis protein
MNASERLRDVSIRHGVYLDRYTRGESLELIKILEQATRDIEERIQRTGGEWTRKRLNEVLSNTRAILHEAIKASEAKLFDDLKLLAEYEAEKAARDFTNSIPIKIQTEQPDPEQLFSSIRNLPASAGSTLGELVAQWDVNTQQRFVAAIRLGVAEGDTVDQLTRRVRGRVVKRATKTTPGVYEGGVLQTTTRGAQALVRTAVAHVNNTAREAVYKQNEDIIKGYQYVATLDSRTCLECGPLDGKVYKLDESLPELPKHPQCRCLLNPVLKSYRELGIDMDDIPPGTRASMDGQVPETLTYSDWLKRQDKVTQDDILGPNRGQMFRNGLKLTSMVDRQGNILTLDRLKEKET